MNLEKINSGKVVTIFLLYLLFLVIIILLLDIIFPLPEIKTFSTVIYSKDNTLLSAYLTKDEKWRMRTNLEEVNPDLIKAIIHKEDKNFFFHFGVDFTAILRAVYLNLSNRKIVSGASTITMQLVRLLEPADRTIINKMGEIVRAIQIELHYSKEEILEMYLSLLPYGGNIEGVKSASYILFDRPPDKLSLSQSIILAVIPNNPNILRADKDNPILFRERNKWIKKFINDKLFEPQILSDALDENLYFRRYEIPKIAPHFCYELTQKHNNDIIKSTLNLSHQYTAERLLGNYINRVKNKGINNGAIIILDNKNLEVSAYVGSHNFYDINNSGQVNGITAIRSPGSTLKPALYAMAFNKGILTPKIKLLDIPKDFSGYEPENYDLKFYGPVTAEFALVNSLNIPAVSLLRQVGFNDFVNLLERTGFHEISKQKKKLGLSLILGGCGASLEQITGLFSSFANKGKSRRIKFTVDEENDEGTEIFSPSAVYMVNEILISNQRPDFPNVLSNITRLPKIAWKTGTSYGRRDAWAIGVNPNFTIGVWIGNFNGKGSPYLSGAEMAVPLLFELFNSIDFGSSQKWFERPKELLIRDVCSETGLIPSHTCNQLEKDFYIENISTGKVCDLKRELIVSLDESIQYCKECMPQSGYKKMLYSFYEPELILWYLKNNIKIQIPPPHNPECNARFTIGGPKIISPSVNFEYLIEEGSEQMITLQAASDISIKKHYWYVNDVFIAEINPGEKFFIQPKKGKNKITCVDELGRNETIYINVKFY